MIKIVFIAFMLSVLTGCSNNQLYHAGQDYQKSKCVEEAVTDQQQINCLKNDKKTYEEYEKERKNTIKK